MGRSLNDVIASLPRDQQEQIEARYEELKQEVEGLREMRQIAGKAQEDIAAALAAMPAPRLLATTPVHLRALVESGVALPALCGIVSATAPLSQELAATAEARFGCEVREMFGSTETCVIAQRRTACEAAWTPLPGVRLDIADPDAAGEVPVLSSTGTAELQLMRHPLVMVAPEYSEVFNAGFTGSLLSSQNVLFRDPQALWEGIAEQELEGNVLSVDRVADAGAVRTQSAAQLAVIQGISLALLTAALLSSTAISAHIHCVSAQREIFLRRSAGMRWRRVHRRVLSVDAAASAAVAGVCLVALVALHVPFAWLALAVPVVFILGDGLLLARSGQRQMDSITERTI